MAYDTNQLLLNFHNDKVFVDVNSLDQARARRQANRDRLERGLKKNDAPLPIEYVPQGSYAMHTMTQSDIDSSDIDDGVIFTQDSLKFSNGQDRSPLEAKKMVCDALSKDEVFNKPPEIRNNCVRIYYNDGFHVDMPVYREFKENGLSRKELASNTGWRRSSPEDITEWFNGQVTDKSPDTTNGRQMRRIVRLLKYWSKSRASWNMPSGFIISILVDEAYSSGILNRDDQVLLIVMRQIFARLSGNSNIHSPVSPYELVTKTNSVTSLEAMRTALASAIEELSKIEQSDCNELMAIKALKVIFYTNYWDQRICELESVTNDSRNRLYAEPKNPIDKQGGTGQYA